MKLNKTTLNKILRASNSVIADAFAYEFRADEFTLRLSRTEVDAITSAVGAKSQPGTIAITNFADVEPVTIPSDISKYVAFASKDQARPLLCAINFTPKSIYATDSYRLLKGVNVSAIVGAYDAFALELVSLVNEDLRVGHINYESGEMQFGNLLPKDGWIALFRVPGEYPNVDALISNDPTEQITIGDLPKSVANRNSHISNDVFATFFNREILLSSANGNSGEQELISTVSAWGKVGEEGNEFQAVAFNFKFLKIALDALPSRGVYEYVYRGVSKPLQFECGVYTVLLMPTRMKGKIVDSRGVSLLDFESVYDREAVAV